MPRHDIFVTMPSDLSHRVFSRLIQRIVGRLDLSVLPELQLQDLRSYAVTTVDQDIPFLGSAFFIGFVIKHPFHHSFAVVFQGDNPEAH